MSKVPADMLSLFLLITLSDFNSKIAPMPKVIIAIWPVTKTFANEVTTVIGIKIIIPSKIYVSIVEIADFGFIVLLLRLFKYVVNYLFRSKKIYIYKSMYYSIE